MRMALNVYAFTCGWLTLPAALLLAGEKASLTVPVPSYLIEHPGGRAIFDSGLHGCRRFCKLFRYFRLFMR